MQGTTGDHIMRTSEFDANVQLARGARGAHRQNYVPPRRQSLGVKLAALALWLTFSAALGVILALALSK
jgi:hypothetical protein